MEAFLNEKSLHSQFGCLADFSASLAGVNRLLSRISESTVEKNVFYDPLLYHSVVFGGQIFASCLKHINDKSVSLNFILMRDRLKFINWRQEQLHTDNECLLDGADILGSSLAEIAERVFRSREAFLLNFSPSNFSTTNLLIVQRGEIQVPLHSISSESDWSIWCALFPELGLSQHDPSCGRPPLDSETILINKGRFSRTNYKNQGRFVYQDRNTSYYFCVDNLHHYGAHLEVFNAVGEHIGEASLRGVLDTSKVDRAKTLSL